MAQSNRNTLAAADENGAAPRRRRERGGDHAKRPPRPRRLRGATAARPEHEREAGDGRPGAVERWRKWQAHQYLPGYFAGGRVPPFYRGRRPNRFGCGLVLLRLLATAGVAAAALTAAWPWSSGTALAVVVSVGMALLLLAAGAALLWWRQNGRREG